MNCFSDFYEVAMVLCGLDPHDDEEFETSEDKVDEILYEKYNIDEESFELLMRDLVKLTPVVQTELAKTCVVGFVDHKKHLFLYKEDFKQ